MKQFYDLIEGFKKEGQTAPVYTIIGTEELLISEAVGKIVEAALTGAVRDFNYHIFYAKESSIDEALDAARTLPLMASRRVVILKDVDQYPASAHERLADYLSNPSPSTCLILTAAKIDQRTKFYKAVDKGSRVILFGVIYENQVRQWIRYRAKSYGLEFTEEGINLFFEVSGSELGIIDNELKKLASYIEGKKKIDASDVEDAVGRSRVYSVFNLIDAIGERKVEKALLILKKMLNNDEHPLGILFMIARQFRLMAKAIEFQKNGLSAGEMSKRLGLPVNILTNNLMKQIKNFTLDEVLKKYRLFYYADSELKGSIKSPEIILDNLVLKLCSRAGEASV